MPKAERLRQAVARALRLSLVSAGKGHEDNRDELTCGHPAIEPLFDKRQVLGMKARADRNHHAPTGFQLRDERWRDVTDRGRDDDTVEWRFLRPAVVTIGCTNRDVLVPEALHQLAGLAGKLCDDLHAVDL